jgi:methionyl-tRNA synthetase
MSKRYYLTTPIYYVNSVPHIGTTLTTVIGDICKRYQLMRGENPFYLTGTDENGLKVLDAAEKAGKTPMEFVDDISRRFVEVFDAMNVSYDVFFRTTSEQHRKTVQALFEKLKENGHIYQGVYEGWYDVGSETFYKESDLVDGKSPDGNEVQWVSEDNWFFKLSAFESELLDHISANPDFLLPESRKNEVVSFLKQGLRDMCITRKNPGWGIPLPWDETKVVYVWFDALINYLAATGWPDDPNWDNLWPANVHWMAKEIFTRFHATLWPAMLMGAGLPLPTIVIAHGWFVFGDQKMSKSLGNVIAPLELADEIQEKTGCSNQMKIDAVRWSLARLMPYEGDTNYNRDEVDKHYNADLANDLGNALNRSLAMAHKFVDGKVPDAPAEDDAIEAIQAAKQKYAMAMDVLNVPDAADAAIGLMRFLNKYIDTRAPWALAKSNDPALGSVIRSMLACLRAAETLVSPVIPWAADEIAKQLGHEPCRDWNELGKPTTLIPGTTLATPEPIFPRIDPQKAKVVQDRLFGAGTSENPRSKVKNPKSDSIDPNPQTPNSMADQSTIHNPQSTTDEITIDDFMKVKLKVARILEAIPLEGSDKLMKLQVVVGDEQRQVIAGIRKSYDALDLIGRQVILVSNLKPAKLRGEMSEGMLLAAVDDDGNAILLQPDREAPEGGQVR